MSKNLELTNQCIEHWENMIAEVKTFSKEKAVEKPTSYTLKESWGKFGCAYCRAYHSKGCPECPFVTVLSHQCYAPTWRLVDEAETWIEWLKHAKELLSELFVIQNVLTKKEVKLSNGYFYNYQSVETIDENDEEQEKDIVFGKLHKKVSELYITQKANVKRIEEILEELED